MLSASVTADGIERNELRPLAPEVAKNILFVSVHHEESLILGQRVTSLCVKFINIIA